jgi:hypothetical protein
VIGFVRVRALSRKLTVKCEHLEGRKNIPIYGQKWPREAMSPPPRKQMYSPTLEGLEAAVVPSTITSSQQHAFYPVDGRLSAKGRHVPDRNDFPHARPSFYTANIPSLRMGDRSEPMFHQRQKMRQ